MFSSHEHLKRKTPEQGINRQEFIEHLVEEYYTTTNVEAQEQVTANLANFAYDPINWEYLKTAEVLNLFMELLDNPNENLQLHASAGLCNICLDQESINYIVNDQNLKNIKKRLFLTRNPNIILNLLTLFYQLIANQLRAKANILCASVLKQIKEFNLRYENDKRIVNIISLLLEEFGKRYELIEINTNMPSTNSTMAK
ncbi:hypothetical protein DOY81_000923 [Sarcophaga bullata]|nr:hypothetical protein DOY81_000923 [Sarcophaga bullata]